MERIAGPHCYAFYWGNDAFATSADDDIDAFFLTDFLARQFESFVIEPLGLDRHPELRDMYFGNYRRLVFLAQTEDAELEAKARDAAERLGLAFEKRVTGMGDLAGFLKAFVPYDAPGRPVADLAVTLPCARREPSPSLFRFHAALQRSEMIQTDGLLLLFALLTLENAGIPVPGEASLIAASIYAGSTGGIGLAAVVIVATAAIVIGGTVGYSIGRTLGSHLLVHYGRYIWLNEARLKTGRYLFMRHGGKIVFFGRFVVLIRTALTLVAGANRMGFSHFLVVNTLGGFMWVRRRRQQRLSLRP